MSCCLYELKFPNGKRYFGITNDLRRRVYEHRNDAKRGSKMMVHAAIRKYGPHNFEARKIVVGDRKYIIDLEISAIKTFETNKKNRGYNISPGGYIPSIETRKKFSAAWKRRFDNPEGRKQLSDQAKRVKSADECAALSRALTGKIRSPEHAKKIGLAQNGRKQSPERVALMLASLTPEVRARISASQKGRPSNNGVTERNKARRGERRTAEQIERMRAGMIAAWAKRKALN